LYHDEEISIRARYAEENLLIVPFFLNSMDFQRTEIFGLGQIVQIELHLAKKAHFKMWREHDKEVFPMVFSSDRRGCQGRSGGLGQGSCTGSGIKVPARIDTGKISTAREKLF
jgi:hypothetical protein